MTLWLKNGNVLVNSGGQVVDDTHCCCGCSADGDCSGCSANITVNVGTVCGLVGPNPITIPYLGACEWYGQQRYDVIGLIAATITCVNGAWQIVVNYQDVPYAYPDPSKVIYGQWIGTLNSGVCPVSCTATGVICDPSYVNGCYYTVLNQLDHHACTGAPVISIVV